MLYMASAFDFTERCDIPGDAERHYLDYHVPLARRLPGLRHYVIGRLVGMRSIPAEHARGAILAFESLEALRALAGRHRAARGREAIDRATTRDSDRW